MEKRIVVSSDHAGFELKQAIKVFLKENDYQVDDIGTDSTEPVDYPIFTYEAAERISNGEYNRGIVFCGTGQGDAIVANKLPGIRAALCWDMNSAKLSRSHNDSNILVLGGWVLGKNLAIEIVRIWLSTPFTGGRHQRRLEQIKEIEFNSYLHRRKVHDLSLSIYPGMIVWPGDPVVSIDSAKSIAKGDSSNISLLHMGSHSATHIDAPSHFIKNAFGIDSINPVALMGPARLLQLPMISQIDCNLLMGFDLRGVSRLLFGTDNSALLKKEQVDTNYAYLTEDAASYLVELGIKLVGIDYLSIEAFNKVGHPVHHILLAAGVVIIEGLYLSDIPPGNYELLCLPLNIKDGDAAPARVFLREV
jgi:arylformamidase